MLVYYYIYIYNGGFQYLYILYNGVLQNFRVLLRRARKGLSDDIKVETKTNKYGVIFTAKKKHQKTGEKKLDDLKVVVCLERCISRQKKALKSLTSSKLWYA